MSARDQPPPPPPPEQPQDRPTTSGERTTPAGGQSETNSGRRGPESSGAEHPRPADKAEPAGADRQQTPEPGDVAPPRPTDRAQPAEPDPQRGPQRDPEVKGLVPERLDGPGLQPTPEVQAELDSYRSEKESKLADVTPGPPETDADASKAIATPEFDQLDSPAPVRDEGNPPDSNHPTEAKPKVLQTWEIPPSDSGGRSGVPDHDGRLEHRDRHLASAGDFPAQIHPRTMTYEQHPAGLEHIDLSPREGVELTLSIDKTKAAEAIPELNRDLRDGELGVALCDDRGRVLGFDLLDGGVTDKWAIQGAVAGVERAEVLSENRAVARDVAESAKAIGRGVVKSVTDLAMKDRAGLPPLDEAASMARHVRGELPVSRSATVESYIPDRPKTIRLEAPVVEPVPAEVGKSVHSKLEGLQTRQEISATEAGRVANHIDALIERSNHVLARGEALNKTDLDSLRRLRFASGQEAYIKRFTWEGRPPEVDPRV